MAILKPHPYLHIKRISIKVWSLRNQIESLVQSFLENRPADADIKLKDYKEIVKLFNEEWILREYFDLPQFKEGEAEALPPNPEELPIPDAPPPENNNKNNLELFNQLHKIKPNAELIGKGHTFLSDIDFFSINFFSSIPFIIGQSILIQFEVPRQFVMSGEILRCHNYNRQSTVISDVRPEYRIQARFSFKRVGERTLLRKFLESIHIDDPSKGKAKKAEAPAGGGDDDGPTAEDIAALGL